jgi:hypothetical protein
MSLNSKIISLALKRINPLEDSLTGTKPVCALSGLAEDGTATGLNTNSPFWYDDPASNRKASTHAERAAIVWDWQPSHGRGSRRRSAQFPKMSSS